MQDPSQDTKEIEMENKISVECTQLQEKKGYQVKKTIAKLKKSYSKSFKQRQIVIVPIFQNRFIFNHKFIVFGFVEIETQYKDYTDIFDRELINVSNQIMKIISIEKKNNQQMVALNIQTDGYSGLRDFRFLIDHFSQYPDQKYKELYESLIEYQSFCNSYLIHYLELSQKVKSRIINEDQILEAIQNYEIYMDEYIKQNYNESDFIFNGYSTINFQSTDVEPRRFKISYALLSLLGLEPAQTDQEFLHSMINFTNLSGIERLGETLSQIKLFSKYINKTAYEQTIITADGISFKAQLDFEIIQWPEMPDFLYKYDLIGVVVKINISLNQIKAIIDIRSSQNKDTLYNIYFPNMNNDLEYTIQSEMFLEKFYPQLFKNPESKKSLTLRKLNKQINSQ